jgi:transposase
MGWRSGQSYSRDLRDRVLAAVDGGTAVRQAAVTFKVSIAYIYKALIRRRLTGDAGPNPNRGRPPRKLSGEQELALAAHIRSRPGITLAQAQAWLKAEHGVTLSTGAMWNAAKRLGLSFKKSAASRRAGPAGCRRAAQAVESGPAVHRS